MTHHRKKWYDDRPVKIALVSGFFSTFITLINVVASRLLMK